eukprot:1161171-Pelagomonas_calceolata.AAC.3
MDANGGSLQRTAGQQAGGKRLYTQCLRCTANARRSFGMKIDGQDKRLLLPLVLATCQTYPAARLAEQGVERYKHVPKRTLRQGWLSRVSKATSVCASSWKLGTPKGGPGWDLKREAMMELQVRCVIERAVGCVGNMKEECCM